jgi:hypothetical protein
MKDHVMVFWVLIPGTEVAMLPSLHLEDGGSIALRNAGIPPHQYMASRSRRPQLKSDTEQLRQ